MLLTLACCLALLIETSEALLLGNLIGCSSFGCRLTALESDVAHLKQQVARMDPSGMINNYRPNNMLPINRPINNQQGSQSNLPANGNLNNLPANGNLNNLPANGNQQQLPVQQAASADGGGGRVNYALDFPLNQQVFRGNYPTNQQQQQFFQ